MTDLRSTCPKQTLPSLFLFRCTFQLDQVTFNDVKHHSGKKLSRREVVALRCTILPFFFMPYCHAAMGLPFLAFIVYDRNKDTLPGKF